MTQAPMPTNVTELKKFVEEVISDKVSKGELAVYRKGCRAYSQSIGKFCGLPEHHSGSHCNGTNLASDWTVSESCSRYGDSNERV